MPLQRSTGPDGWALRQKFDIRVYILRSAMTDVTTKMKRCLLDKIHRWGVAYRNNNDDDKVVVWKEGVATTHFRFVTKRRLEYCEAWEEGHPFHRTIFYSEDALAAWIDAKVIHLLNNH
jgi:hypothetical protein